MEKRTSIFSLSAAFSFLSFVCTPLVCSLLLRHKKKYKRPRRPPNKRNPDTPKRHRVCVALPTRGLRRQRQQQPKQRGGRRQQLSSIIERLKKGKKYVINSPGPPALHVGDVVKKYFFEGAKVLFFGYFLNGVVCVYVHVYAWVRRKVLFFVFFSKIG